MKTGDVLVIEKFGKGVVFGESEDMVFIGSERGVTPMHRKSIKIEEYEGNKKLNYEKVAELLSHAMYDMYWENVDNENGKWSMQGLANDLLDEIDFDAIKQKSKFTKDDLASWCILELENGVFLQYHKRWQGDGCKDGALYGVDMTIDDAIDIVMDEFSYELTHLEDESYSVVGVYKVKDYLDQHLSNLFEKDNLELILKINK